MSDGEESRYARWSWIRTWFLVMAIGILAFIVVADMRQEGERALTSLFLLVAASHSVCLSAIAIAAGWVPAILLVRASRCVPPSLARRWAIVDPPTLTIAASSALVLLTLWVDLKVRSLLGRHIGPLELEMAFHASFLTDSGIELDTVRHFASTALLAFGLLVATIHTVRLLIPRVPSLLWKGALGVLLLMVAGEKTIAAYFRSHATVQAVQSLVPLYAGFGPSRRDAVRRLSPGKYPLAAYSEIPMPSTPDVLVIVVESFRPDVVTKEVMPYLSSLADRSFFGAQHYAGANCTHFGLVPILYGTNVAISPTLNAGKVGSYPISWLRQKGYRTSFYASNSMSWLGARRVLLEQNFDTIVERTEGPTWERDAGLVDEFLADLEKSERLPQLAFVMLNSTHHDYYYPSDFEKFRPALPESRLLLMADYESHRDEIVNRYRNAAGYVDHVISKLVDGFTKVRGREPIVVVTGDHGEAMLEHGNLLHSRTLHDEEIRTPLIISGLKELSGRSNAPTGNEQILPTLLSHLAPGVEVNVSGTGHPIGAPREHPFLIAHCNASYDSLSHRWAAIFPDGKTLFELGVANGEMNIELAKGGAEPDERRPAILERLRYFEGAVDAMRLEQARATSGFCESLEIDGRRFFYCHAEAPWDRAAEWCSAHGLALARIDNEAENEGIGTLVRRPGWIGVKESSGGAVSWADGTPMKFSAWREEPEDERTDPSCAVYGFPYERRWTRKSCSSHFPFYCSGAVDSPVLHEPQALRARRDTSITSPD